MALNQCPNCKRDIISTSEYCSFCGHKVVKEKPKIVPKWIESVSY